MITTATTIRAGVRYQLGDHVIWFDAKPGKGNRVALFVRSASMTLVRKVDRDGDLGDNDAEDAD